MMILMRNPLPHLPLPQLGRGLHFVSALFVKSTSAESAVLLFIPGSGCAAHWEQVRHFNFFFMRHSLSHVSLHFRFSRPNMCGSFHCCLCDAVSRPRRVRGLDLSVSSGSSTPFLHFGSWCQARSRHSCPNPEEGEPLRSCSE